MFIPADQNDKVLLQRLSEGDERAFIMLYDKHWEDLFVHAVRILKNHSEAEDVVQEVFAKVWQIKRTLLNVRDLKPYLLTITRNQSLKSILKSKRLNAGLDSFINFVDTCYPSIEKEYEAKELSSLIDIQVNDLPEKMREIFVMSRGNGLSNKEIADSLNISEHTVKKQINNSIRRIRSSIRYLFILFIP